MLLDPAAMEQKEVAGFDSDGSRRRRDFVMDAKGAEAKGEVAEVPAKAVGGYPRALTDCNEGDEGAGLSGDELRAINKADRKVIVVNRDARLAAEGGEDGEVGESVVGAAASGADHIDFRSATFNSEGDGFLKVSHVEARDVVEPPGRQTLPGMGAR